MHAVWTLLPGDSDYSGRWQAIKIAFAKAQPLAASVLGTYDPR